MTLKTKLSCGLGFLFLIIFTLVGFCSYYVGSLDQDTSNILKDNYNSIVYSKNMLSGLDDMKTSINSILYKTSNAKRMADYNIKLFESGKNLFEDNLKAEKNNITEINEKEYVDKLTNDYDMYLKLCLQMKKGIDGNSTHLNDYLNAGEKLKQSIYNIYDVNMMAVVRKTNLTKHDSDRFKHSMVIIGLICFILALGYFWYFPVYISTTLSYLSDKMKNLLKNSGIVFDIKTNDEAYIILQAINLLENKLGIKK
jgi:two-component system, NtrC family, sensor histidine kinase KinB